MVPTIRCCRRQPRSLRVFRTAWSKAPWKSMARVCRRRTPHHCSNASRAQKRRARPRDMVWVSLSYAQLPSVTAVKRTSHARRMALASRFGFTKASAHSILSGHSAAHSGFPNKLGSLSARPRSYGPCLSVGKRAANLQSIHNVCASILSLRISRAARARAASSSARASLAWRSA